MCIRHGQTLEESAHLRRPNGGVPPQGRGRAGGAAAGQRRARTRGRARPGARASRNAGELAARCSVDFDFEQYRFPGFPVPVGRDGVLLPRAALPRGHARGATSRSSRAVRQAAGARAGGDRADRPGRVLPDLLGHHAFLPRARDPGPGAGQRRRFDRRLRAGHHARRPDPPRAALRALHQRGPHDLPGRGHRLRLVAPRGGHPVLLRALRRRAHRHGLQPRHVPGALGGARGRLRARLPAAAGRSRGQGARDVRLGHGPARPRGGGRLRRVLRRARGRRHPDGAGARQRSARLRRRHGPARRRLAPVVATCGPRPSDDEGGPGDTPVSVAGLRRRGGRAGIDGGAGAHERHAVAHAAPMSSPTAAPDHRRRASAPMPSLDPLPPRRSRLDASGCRPGIAGWS